MLLAAGLAPLLCSLTPGSRVRAQLRPRNRWRHAAGERGPAGTVPVPSPPVMDPDGVGYGFLCSSPLPWGHRTWRSYPFMNAHQEAQGLKSARPEGFHKTIEFG